MSYSPTFENHVYNLVFGQNMGYTSLPELSVIGRECKLVSDKTFYTWSVSGQLKHSVIDEQ